MKNVKALVGVALVLGCGIVDAGSIKNPGFETGDLTDWDDNVIGGGSVEFAQFSHTSIKNPPGGGPNPPPSPPYPSDYPFNYAPTEGDWFLMLGTGSAEPDDWQTVTQTIFNVAQGETLSGYAAFDWDDGGRFLDGARVRILDDQGNQIDQPFYMDGALLLNTGLPFNQSYYGNGPWTLWSWTASAAGTYTLEYGVANTEDGFRSSYGYFDTIPTAPEPSALALFVIGLAGLTSIKRRKTNPII